ncbi:Translation elongation factor aef-2, partial [Globisporangium splendens]
MRRRELLEHRQNIRHVAVVAHAHAGKTTLISTLAALVSVVQADAKESDERNQCSCMSVPLCYTHHGSIGSEEHPGKAVGDGSSVEVDAPQASEYLINVIDTPGHVELSADITTALRVSDGALVLVDCSGEHHPCGLMGMRTEQLLRQALDERVKPVVLVNKLDDALRNGHMAPEECYNMIASAIESVNHVLTTYECEEDVTGDWRVDPSKGTVAFGSAKHGWGFTLATFARLYADRFGIHETKMLAKLWGDWCYDIETKAWVQAPAADYSNGTRKRAFCQFVLDPLFKLYYTARHETSEDSDTNKFGAMLAALGVGYEDCITAEGNEAERVYCVLQRWLPLTDAVLNMVVVHLPSPVTAQRHRVRTLYAGSMDDECARAIRECDSNGPLVVCVSRVVQQLKTISKGSQSRRLYAFGRVFAGRITSGQQVRLCTPTYAPLRSTIDGEFQAQTVEQVLMTTMESCGDDGISAGNTCVLVGIDQYLKKTGTLTTADSGCSIRGMKFPVAPVLRVTVAPKREGDLPQVVEAMKRLTQLDPIAACSLEEEFSAGPVLTCTGEHHMKRCLDVLRAQLRGDNEDDEASEACELVVSEPIVCYRESISSVSSQTCLVKSPNKHNRFFCTSEPLSDQFLRDTTQGKLMLPLDTNAVAASKKRRAQYLVVHHGWNENDARKIWCFGPNSNGPNVLVDQTRQVAYLNEIKDSALWGFHWATQGGALCDEPLHGMRVNLLDVTMMNGAIKRGAGQIIPTIRRAVFACQMASKPILLEPVYAVAFECRSSLVDRCTQALCDRRGRILSIEVLHPLQAIDDNSDVIGTLVKAHLPVSEASGFHYDFTEIAGEDARIHCIFDERHYDVVAGDPQDAGTAAGGIVRMLRRWKGLRPELPTFESLCDKL